MTARTKPVPWISPSSLERLREELDVSWTKLAKRIGISYQTLLRMRDGRSNGLPVVQNRIRELMESEGVIDG